MFVASEELSLHSLQYSPKWRLFCKWPWGLVAPAHGEALRASLERRLPGVSDWQISCSYIATLHFSGDTLKKQRVLRWEEWITTAIVSCLWPTDVSFFLSDPRSEMGNYERHLSKKWKLPLWVFFCLLVWFLFIILQTIAILAVSCRIQQTPIWVTNTTCY